MGIKIVNRVKRFDLLGPRVFRGSFFMYKSWQGLVTVIICGRFDI